MLKRHIKTLFLLTAILSTLEMAAQPRFTVRKFSADDGLKSTVQNIAQDKNGVMWFATWSGLCKYDGYTFKHYISRSGDGSSISNNRLVQISPARDGGIWCLSYDEKLYLFDTGREEFTDIPGVTDSGVEVTELRTGADSCTWAVFGDGRVLKLEGDRTRPEAIPESMLDVPAERILGTDSRGGTWSSDGSKGILRKDASGHTKRYFTSPSTLPESEKQLYSNMIELPGGIILASPVGGILGWYNGDTDELVPIEGMDIFNDFTDRQGNLWSSTKHELIELCTSMTDYSIREKGKEIRGLFSDSRGRVWETTTDNEIIIRNADGSLEGYLHPDGSIRQARASFGHMFYGMVEQPDGTLFAASRLKGLIVLEPVSNDGRHYRVHAYPNYSPGISEGPTPTFTIFRDEEGRIWIGTYGEGLYLVENPSDPGHLRFTYPAGYQRAQFQKIRSFFESDGVVFVCTTDGIAVFDASERRPDEIVFHFHQRSPARKDGLNSNNVMKMFKDSRGSLFAVCYSGGPSEIISHDLLSEELSFDNNLRTRDFTPDLVHSMIEDRDGNFWIIQEKDIIKYSPVNSETEEFRNSFFAEDLSFSEAMPLRDSLDNLLIATSKGILSFNARDLHRSRFNPNIVFTGIRSADTDLGRERYGSGSLTLDKDERDFSISFAALDYAGTENIRYAYRLLGRDSTWNYPGKTRTANYIDIPHGHYTFQVRSTNSDGVWCDNTSDLVIDVRPTFRETPWAVLLYILTGILLIAASVILTLYIFRLKREVDVEQQVTDMKLKFFTDLSHELRTPLTLINGPIEEVLEDENLSGEARGNLLEAKRNSDWMLKIIGQILDFRKLQSGKMRLNLENLDMAAFVRRVYENFQPLAREHGNPFNFSSDTDSLYMWCDADKLEKILYNLLSNAFKYTPRGKKISVSLTHTADEVKVAVADEGIGIPEKDKARLFKRFETVGHRNPSSSTGIGLSLVKEYVDMLHGSIEVESEEDKGSTFSITLPLGKEVFGNGEDVEFIVGEPQDEGAPEDAGTTEESLQGAGKLLLVEDNVPLRNFLKNMLKKNYTVIEADNGESGLEAAVKEIPDIIITDLMMPGMDGGEMIEAIKQNRDICHIPIIILSAKASLDERIQGLRTGVDDYITKPFSSSYLKARIQQLLEKRSEMQQMILESGGKAMTTHSLPHADKEFLDSLSAFAHENLSDSGLGVDGMASAMNMSRSVLYRKVKALTGLSPVGYLQDLRIRQAARLLAEGYGNVADIAYMTGFTDPKYFTRCFKKVLGTTPSEYRGKKHS